MEQILQKKVEDKICILTIQRPQALNALNTQVLEELNRELDNIQKEDIRVLILTGAGKAFVAGADISEMATMNGEEGRAFGLLGAKVFRKLEELEIPTIAMVNGYALGGGMELAMSCDIRIASEKAKFGQPETGLGITPGFSGTQRLSKIVGIAKAKELIYTAKIISSEEALQIGLINHITDVEGLEEAALDMAKKISANAPLAVKYSKKAINQSLEMSIDQGIQMESYLFGLCFATEDQKEGMQAFLDKRSPEFQNR